jgi:acyl-CoA thioester hydrolase
MKTLFALPIRVYYEDTDAGGVVYHSNYLNFFERARTEMLRDLGFEQNELREENGVIFAVRSMQIDYLRPAKFNDLLAVSATISRTKKASLTFEQTIKRKDEMLCTASCRIACLDADKLQPTAIPDFLLQQFLTKNNEH